MGSSDARFVSDICRDFCGTYFATPDPGRPGASAEALVVDFVLHRTPNFDTRHVPEHCLSPHGPKFVSVVAIRQVHDLLVKLSTNVAAKLAGNAIKIVRLRATNGS